VGQSIIIAALFSPALQNIPRLPPVKISVPIKAVCVIPYLQVKDFYPVLRGALFHALHIFMEGREE